MTTEAKALLDTVPASFVSGPEWLRSLRSRAADALREQGLPTKKTEAWRFTPLRSVVKARFEPRSGAGPELVEPVPEGVTVRSLREVLEREPVLLEGKLGSNPSEHFSALNTALFEDGLWVDVESGVQVSKPIQLRHRLGPSAGSPVVYPRALVTLAEGSEVSLLETYTCDPGEHLTNAVAEVHVGRNAKLDHVRVHENAGFQVGRVDVHQDRDSSYRSVVVTLGGALLRFDVRVLLEGPGAECQLDGAYLVEGDDHVDHHTLVEHRAPRCSSRQTYRGIASERGTAVFDGIVVVHRDAQKTEAHQENRNLLLSESATVHTKPHLEIDADDVVCSHGATVGALDEEQLFYLRARGIPEELARAMLTFAFIEQIVDEVGHEGTRNRLRDAVLARIPRGDAIREVT